MPALPENDGEETPDRIDRGVDIMFAFFSTRLGCIGSILVSLLGTVLLVLLMRSCS
jgi:hypothetical protein